MTRHTGKCRKMRMKPKLLKAGTASVVAILAATAVAQDAPELYLDLSTGLRFDDNYESLEQPVGTTHLWSTDVALGYASETDVQTFSAVAGTTLEIGEYAEDPDNNGGFVDQFMRLDYGRFGKDSILDSYLSYRESDNGISFTRIPERSTDLIVDQGRRSDGRFHLGFTKGRESPVSSDVSFDFHRIRYFDTSDPGLTDEDRISFDGELGLAMTRTLDLLLTASYYDFDDLEDISDDERRAAAGIGIRADINKSLTFSGVLSHARNSYTQTINGSRDTRYDESPALDLRLVQDLPNGAMNVALGNDLTSTGLQTTLSFGRGLELRSGGLDFTIGATHTDDGDINGVGSLDWRQELKRSSFSVNFRSAVNTEDDRDVLNSYLGARYQRELTKLAGLEFDLFAAASEGLTIDGDDRQQAGVGIRYYHALTRDWQFVTGYRHSYSVDELEATTTRNVVFATIDRRFSLRP